MCSYGSQTTKAGTTRSIGSKGTLLYRSESLLTAKIRRTALELQALIFFHITEVTEAIPKILTNFIYALDGSFQKARLGFYSTFIHSCSNNRQTVRISSFSHCGKIQRLREKRDLESNVLCILTTSTLLQSNSNFFFGRLWGQDRALTFRQSSNQLGNPQFRRGAKVNLGELQNYNFISKQ